MSTNDSDITTGRHTRRMVPGEGRWVPDADWGSWIDPNDARDSLRADTIEALRSELRVSERTPDARYDGPEEDLTTVNARLRSRVLELSRQNRDMDSMLAGTGIATVFLDRDLKVLRMTPAASQIVDLTTSRIGRPVSGLVSSPIDYDRIVGEARPVLETLCSREVDVQAGNGRWYQMHVHPYRTVDSTIEGAVVSFFDVTETRAASQEIARQLAEKENQLKEVHHRVRNNTASIAGLLSIQAQSITDPDVRSVLKGAIGRVESMSVLYDRLLAREEYGASSAKDYLESLAKSAMALVPDGSKITLETHIGDFNLNTDHLFLLGLITNELLANAVKYAFGSRTDGLIMLALERSGDRVSLVVQDDGMGSPAGFVPAAAHGFGLTLIRMLSEQLGGSFSITNRNGTRSVLEFAL